MNIRKFLLTVVALSAFLPVYAMENLNPNDIHTVDDIPPEYLNQAKSLSVLARWNKPDLFKEILNRRAVRERSPISSAIEDSAGIQHDLPTDVINEIVNFSVGLPTYRKRVGKKLCTVIGNTDINIPKLIADLAFGTKIYDLDLNETFGGGSTVLMEQVAKQKGSEYTVWTR